MLSTETTPPRSWCTQENWYKAGMRTFAALWVEAMDEANLRE